jgi:hypothetical protein
MHLNPKIILRSAWGGVNLRLYGCTYAVDTHSHVLFMMPPVRAVHTGAPVVCSSPHLLPALPPILNLREGGFMRTRYPLSLRFLLFLLLCAKSLQKQSASMSLV